MNNKKQKIHLRALEPEDIESVYRWENDPDVWKWSAAHQPFSHHALSKYIDEYSLLDIYSSRQLRLMADKEGDVVGCVDLFDFDPFHRRAGVGIIVDVARRREGIGTDMIEGLHDFAKEHLQLHQLHCIIAADNLPSLGLFRKCGYQSCGVLAQWLFQDGKWVDAQMLQKIL